MTNENPYESTSKIGDERRPKSSAPFTLASILCVVCILGLMVVLFFPGRRNARPAARRTQCANNLKQIGIGLHTYLDNYGSLPPAFTVDEEGQPLHSWRTLILPYVEQEALYKSIDLSKPWNHPDNAEAMNKYPPVYRCPSSGASRCDTPYVVINSRDGCFFDSMSRSYEEILDGMSNTVMVVEVPDANAVHWMSPMDTDLKFFTGINEETRLVHNETMGILLGDGSIRHMEVNKLTPAQRRAWVTIAASDDPSDPAGSTTAAEDSN